MSYKIQVCNVHEDGRFGGPANRIIQVAKSLKPLGVDTHVVYPNLDSTRFAYELSLAEVSSSALHITRLSKEKKTLAKYILFFPFEIMRYCYFFHKHGFDLIHVNGSFQFKVAIAAKLVRIPVIWHLNDTQMDAIVKKICIVLAQYCASGFIVTGKRVYDYYIRGTTLEEKPYYEIQAPVDTSLFDPKNVASNKEVSQTQKIKIVTVAGINPTKGLEYFIEMGSNLAQQHKDIVFFVAGAELSSHQKYYQKLKNLLASTELTNNDFLFVGMIDNVPSFLQSADIFVFTSLSESGPATVWEAMSMGKPIVTTDVGSVSQYIEDGISGFIVPIKDPAALSEKVKILIENPALRKKMGEKARAVATAKLDVSKAAGKHAKFYRQILDGCK